MNNKEFFRWCSNVFRAVEFFSVLCLLSVSSVSSILSSLNVSSVRSVY